jgi:hypothetical protein
VSIVAGYFIKQSRKSTARDPQENERSSMFRKFLSVLVLTATVLQASSTMAAPALAKRHRIRPWHGYGFLPGYRTPERIEWERARSRGPVYWYGYPRFYRGRWNGGGFGPCWTQTPIGNAWNCGR